MQIDFEDAAASAAAALCQARMDGDRAPNMRRLCKELKIRLELVAPHVLRGGHHARYSEVGNRITRRRGLPDWLECWVIAHELGHWWCRLVKRPFSEAEEAWANAFAGALLVPPTPLFQEWRIGHDLADVMAAYPHIAPTCLALRVGEAHLAETLVVQGSAMRYARMESEPSQDLIALGIEAARAGTARRPGVAKALKMPEMPRRAAVVVDGDW